MLGRGGFKEVILREQTGDIEFVIKFRPAEDESLIPNEISIGMDSQNRAVVKKTKWFAMEGIGFCQWGGTDWRLVCL